MPDGDHAFACTVVASVGPVKARFQSRLTLTDIEAPHRYTVLFDGQGGVAGFGRGSAAVALTDEPPGTRLSYTAKVAIGGKLAQVGSRLIEGAAAKVTGEFFARFAAHLGGAHAPGPSHAAAQAARGDTRFPLWFLMVASAGFVAVVAALLRH